MEASRLARDPRAFKTLDSALEDRGILEEVTSAAIKRTIALSLLETMKKEGVTKVALAEKMQTSRRQLDRILSPSGHNITLETLIRAAHCLGRKIKVELI